MTFSTALELIKNGIMVSREAWDNSEFYLFMDLSFRYEKNKPPILMHKDDYECPVEPYTPDIKDILAEDWYIVC